MSGEVFCVFFGSLGSDGAWLKRRSCSDNKTAGREELTIYFTSRKRSTRLCLRLWQRNSRQLFVSYPASHSLDPGPTLTFSLSFSLSWRPFFCFKRPPTDAFMLFSLKAPNTMLVFNSPRVFFFSARAGVVGKTFPNAAETHFQSNPTIRHPTIRHPTIRQPTLHKETRKPINPKQGKAHPGPPSHGETAMARANRMSQDRSTCPRNVKISTRGSEPWTSIKWQLSTTNMA